jgi:hypothetical protein
VIVLKGKAEHVSREQIRAFLHATVAVLSFHNRPPRFSTLTVIIHKRLDGSMGWHLDGKIELCGTLSPEDMLTTCVHEIIHACIEFPDETKEKCTSTLCGKIKGDVAKLANILLDNTYKRAGYLAHTKMAYRARNGDHYDKAEDEPVGVVTKYIRRRA